MTEIVRFDGRSVEFCEFFDGYSWSMFRSLAPERGMHTIDVAFLNTFLIDGPLRLHEPVFGEASAEYFAAWASERSVFIPRHNRLWVFDSGYEQGHVLAAGAYVFRHGFRSAQSVLINATYGFSYLSEVLYPPDYKAVGKSVADQGSAPQMQCAPAEGLDSPELVFQELSRVVAAQSSAGLGTVLDLGLKLGMPRTAAELLASILAEDWHKDHVRVLLLLSELREPRTLELIYKFTLSLDKEYSLIEICIATLMTIQISNAVPYVEKLAESSNGSVRGLALRRLMRPFETLAKGAIPGGGK